MKFMGFLLALCVGALAIQSVQADDAMTQRTERDRIAAERSRLDAAFATREQECQKQFAVTACLDAARRERRAALDRLRLQQDTLDEADRKRRAAQRIEEIRNNVSAEETRRRDNATRQQQKAHETPAASAPPRVARASSTPQHKSNESDPRRAQAYEQRQAEAKAHREAVERRNAERAAKGKLAKPLPTPDAASAAVQR